MDCLPEEKERYQFAKNLVHEVSFLRSVWGEQEDFSDEFLATGFMYDVARKMVSVVQQQEQKTDSVIEKELQLAFALIEAGLYQPESSLIPDLIRGTLCDWFGNPTSTENSTNPVVAVPTFANVILSCMRCCECCCMGIQRCVKKGNADVKSTLVILTNMAFNRCIF